MRFLRIRPAVWAMLSCSFSSFTLKVALGSSSVTTPGNSSISSFAIRLLPAFKSSAENGRGRRQNQGRLLEVRPLLWRVSCLTSVHWRFSLPSLGSNLDVRPSEASYTGDEL